MEKSLIINFMEMAIFWSDFHKATTALYQHMPNKWKIKSPVRESSVLHFKPWQSPMQAKYAWLVREKLKFTQPQILSKLFRKLFKYLKVSVKLAKCNSLKMAHCCFSPPWMASFLDLCFQLICSSLTAINSLLFWVPLQKSPFWPAHQRNEALPSQLFNLNLNQMRYL